MRNRIKDLDLGSAYELFYVKPIDFVFQYDSFFTYKQSKVTF